MRSAAERGRETTRHGQSQDSQHTTSIDLSMYQSVYLSILVKEAHDEVSQPAELGSGAPP